MNRILVIGFLLLTPEVALADRIHLQNGKTFEDVVLVSQTQNRVRFRVSSGEMSLPLSWIERVEEAPSVLQEYLERKRILGSDPESQASAYLGLARWARVRGLQHGFRESILMAGELDPGLDGLAGPMAAIGYFRDSATQVWIAGRTVDPRETLPSGPRSERVLETNPNENAEREVATGLTRAIEALAQAELERSRAPSPSRRPRQEFSKTSAAVYYPLSYGNTVYSAPGWIFPGKPLRPSGSDPTNPVIRQPANPYARALLARPPGSLLPVSAYVH